MTKALVTGATGLVGSNVVERLNHVGWDVRILRRPTSKLHALENLTFEEAVGDILDPDSLLPAMKGVDVVFHVAGAADYWRIGRERLYKINVEGTRHVVEAALKARVDRFVYTSSLAAVGPAPDPEHPVDERQTFNWPPERFPYGHSKWLGEQEVRKGIQQGLDAVIVNPSIVIGPRDSHLTTGSLFKSMKRGLPAVPRGGSGVVDARDVALGHVRAAERGHQGERYILNAENLSHMELARIIAETLGTSPPFLELPPWAIGPVAFLIDILRAIGVPLPARGDTIRLGVYWFYANNRKSISELGLSYRPVVGAVADAVTWLREHGYL